MELSLLREDDRTDSFGTIAQQTEEVSGSTSTVMTIVSMVKTSIGTGVLAVPHAFATGGVCAMSATLVVLAVWNEWSGYRLLECKGLLSLSERSTLIRSSEGPLAALTRVVGGGVIATAVDAVFVILVLGVVPARNLIEYR